jgi:cytochrome c556
MAIEFVGGNTAGKLGATSGDTTIALNGSLTGGIASAVSAGDLVIAAFSTGSAADRTLAITDGTNAYTLIDSELYQNDTEDTNLRVAYKFMGATPDAATTFGPTGNAADAGAMAVYVFRGVDQGTPLDVAAVAAGATNTQLVDPAPITPVSAGAYIVCVGAGAREGLGDFSSSDLTDFRTQSGSDDTNDTTLGIGHKPDWAAGEFNPAAWTHGAADSTNYSWASLTIALRPEVPLGMPVLGNRRKAIALASMLATAFIAAPPHPQVAKKFSPALFEVAAVADEPPGGYSPKIVSIDDPHPPQRGAQIASLLEQPVVVDDKTPYQRPPDVTLHWIPEYVSPQRLAYLTPPPVYLTPGNEDEPPGGSSPKVVSFDDPPLPQVGARIAGILYEPPAVVADDPPFRYRRFQWGEGPAVVTEISFGSIIEPVDGPPRFRPFQDTSNWQPGPPEPIVHKKVPNAFLHLLIEDNHEPPGGSSPKIVSVDDPPLPQVSGKIAAALFVPPAVDDPPRLKQSQDRTAWQPPPPLPTLSGKLHADVLHVEPEPEVEEATGGGWFVTGHLGKPRGGVVKRIIDDGETDDERRQRVFKEILGDLEQVVEEKKPFKVAQAVKAIKRIAKQAPQQTTRSDELINALRRAEAARAEAERLEQLRIAMAIAHDIERALIAAAMLKYQNEQALIALLLAD